MTYAIFLPALLLTACATAPVDRVVAEPGETCRGDALAGFVGQPYSAAIG